VEPVSTACPRRSCASITEPEAATTERAGTSTGTVKKQIMQSTGNTIFFIIVGLMYTLFFFQRMKGKLKSKID
jgi:hypothetical protein